VCGTEGVLTYQWRLKAREQVTELLSEAAAVRTAQAALADTIRRARQLIVASPPALRDGAGAGVDVAPVVELWDAWARVSAEDDAIGQASHLETHGPLLIAAVEATALLLAEQPALDPTWVAFLAGFDIVFLTASWLLCDFLVEE